MQILLAFAVLTGLVALPGSLAAQAESGNARAPAADSSLDRTPDRLIFAATGRVLPPGRSYLAGHWTVLPVVAVGVVDRLMFSTGGPFLFFPIGPFFVAPKIALLRSRDLNVAAGVFLVAPSLREADKAGGWCFVSATAGPPEASFTTLLGVPVAEGAFEGAHDEALAQAGFAGRLAQTVSAIAEVSVLPFADPIGVYALRFSDRRVVMDLGAVHSSGGIGPYAGIAIHW